jgi:hypothetical protein
VLLLVLADAANAQKNSSSYVVSSHNFHTKSIRKLLRREQGQPEKSGAEINLIEEVMRSNTSRDIAGQSCSRQFSGDRCNLFEPSLRCGASSVLKNKYQCAGALDGKVDGATGVAEQNSWHSKPNLPNWLWVDLGVDFGIRGKCLISAVVVHPQKCCQARTKGTYSLCDKEDCSTSRHVLFKIDTMSGIGVGGKTFTIDPPVIAQRYFRFDSGMGGDDYSVISELEVWGYCPRNLIEPSLRCGASSVHKDPYKCAGALDGKVDGATGVAEQNSWHSKPNLPNWLWVDLGIRDQFRISAVVVHPQKCCQARTKGTYSLCDKEDCSTSKHELFKIDTMSGIGVGGKTFTIDPPVIAQRYFRFDSGMGGDAYSVISELEVWGSDH